MGFFGDIIDSVKSGISDVKSVFSYAGDVGKGVLGIGQNLSAGLGQGIAGWGQGMGQIGKGLGDMITNPIFLLAAGAVVLVVLIKK